MLTNVLVLDPKSVERISIVQTPVAARNRGKKSRRLPVVSKAL